MSTLGVHSEVGKLRRVIVHRPDLSLRRLTPTNHDELLFDDVLWVERAQWEHDQFVAQMRARGVEVLYFQQLLAEALAASDEARMRLIDVVARRTPSARAWSIAVRDHLGALPPDDLAKHLIGGLTVAEANLDLGELGKSSLIAAALDDTSTFVLPPLPNTLFTRDSSCWIYGGVSINPMYWPARRRESYNVAAIYRYHPIFHDGGFSFWYPKVMDDGRFHVEDFGLASLEGGDVEIIGRGTVAIGLSERTSARMIEQIALALFEAGAADRVIAAVMTKDRAHMHLDTVFTLLDRDKATAYPQVVNQIGAVSLRPGPRPGTLDIRRESSFVDAVKDALGHPEALDRRDRRRRLPAGTRAVGRRQQRRRARARRGRRVRAQHVHDLEDARGRGRGHPDRRVRARQGSRRRALHDVPDRTRSDLRPDASAPMSGPESTRPGPRADAPRGGAAGRLPDRSARPDDRDLRNRCDRRAAPGRAPHERRVRGAHVAAPGQPDRARSARPRSAASRPRCRPCSSCSRSVP